MRRRAVILDVTRKSRTRGNEYFYWNLLQEHRESWVNIRLDLVSLISPLLSYGFWSNLVPTESYFQGASNVIGYERFGEELAEDVGYYQKLTWWSRSRILVPSFLGTSVLVVRPSKLAALPLVLIRFQRCWGWFWSRKPSLISGILRGECFILWNWFVKSNIVGQRSRMESW